MIKNINYTAKTILLIQSNSITFMALLAVLDRFQALNKEITRTKVYSLN